MNYFVALEAASTCWVAAEQDGLWLNIPARPTAWTQNYRENCSTILWVLWVSITIQILQPKLLLICFQEMWVKVRYLVLSIITIILSLHYLRLHNPSLSFLSSSLPTVYLNTNQEQKSSQLSESQGGGIKCHLHSISFCQKLAQA